MKLACVALIFLTEFSTLSALSDKCEENNLNALMVHFRKLHTDFKMFKESYETQKNASLKELKALQNTTDQLNEQTVKLKSDNQQIHEQKTEEIQKLNEKLQNMTDQLKEETEKLKFDNQQKTEEIQNMTNQLKEETVKLKFDNDQKTEEIQNMTNQLKEETVKLKSDNQQKTEEIQKLNEKLQNMTERLTELTVEKQTTPLVSFVVRLAEEINCTEKLPFGMVLLNEGNGFDNTSNSFKAPYDGIYSLTVQICKKDNNYVTFSVYSQTYNMSYGASTSLNYYYYDCKSLTTVAKLASDEEVYVQVKCYNGNEIFGHIGDYFWTMFSGVLIHLSP